MRLLGIGDNNERVVVRGSDFEMMQMVAEEIRYLLDEQEFVQHTHVSYTPRQPEINLNFDPILLTTYDINRANITSGLTADQIFLFWEILQTFFQRFDYLVRILKGTSGRHYNTYIKPIRIHFFHLLHIQGQ